MFVCLRDRFIDFLLEHPGRTEHVLTVTKNLDVLSPQKATVTTLFKTADAGWLDTQILPLHPTPLTEYRHSAPVALAPHRHTHENTRDDHQ